MSEKKTDKVKFEMWGYSAFTRIVGVNGNSAYVQIPREHLGLEVVVVVRERSDKNTRDNFLQSRKEPLKRL